jgi:hypothetical protein
MRIKNLFKKILPTRKHRLLAVVAILLILIPIIFNTLQSVKEVRADALIGFDEGYGSTAHDSSGSASGTITNAVWKTEDLCHSGKCLYFDGTGDYVSFGDDANLDFAASTNFTINLWFRHTGTISGTQVLIAKYNAATTTDGGYKIYMDSSGHIIFGIDDDQTSFPEDSVTSANSYADAKWHFISAVKTSNTRIDLYIDGQTVGYKTPLSATNTLVNTDAFYVGIDGDGTSNGWMGFIDDLKVYTSSARSSSEVKADYTGQTTARGVSESFGPDNSNLSNGLVGYWNMDSTATPAYSTKIGDTTIQPNDDGNTGGYLVSYQVTLSQAATLQELVFYVRTVSGHLTLGLYSDSSNVPSTLLASTASFTPTTGWNTVAVTPTQLSAGKYWLAFMIENDGLGFQNNNGVAGRLCYTTPGYGTMPSSFGTCENNPNTDTYEFSYYANFYNLVVNPTDQSGNGNTLTNIGPVNTTGKFGNAGSFTATSSQFQYAADSVSLSLTSSLTLSGWIKPSSNTASTQYNIAGKWGSGTETYLLAQYGNEIRLYLGSSSNYVETTGTNLATGTWYQVVATYDASSQKAKIFVNGTQQATSTTGTIPPSLSDTSALFDIGAAGGVVGSLDRQVAAGADDAYEQNFNTNFDGTNQGIVIESNTSAAANTTLGGFRFTNITIPKSAPITTANFQVYADDSGFDDADFYVYAENVDNSANFTTTADVYDRLHSSGTKLSAGWYSGTGLVNTWFGSTVDISPVIQTVINRSGWSSGNALTILAAGTTLTNRQFKVIAYESTLTTLTPKLHIEYFSTNPSNYYDGAIDDVRLYNRTLSAAEVQNLYQWAPGPVAYWKLDEGSGTTAQDSSGNSNTGTITAGTGKYVSGKFGDAYNFDNAATVINAGSGTNLDDLPTSGLTLNAWIYPKGAGENSLGFIMAKNVGTTPNAGWVLRMNSTTSLTFTVDGSTDLVRTTNTSMVTQNAWNYVTVTWDGVITTAASVHIFINGVEATYATTTNGASRVSDASSTFYIGNDSTSARTFNGYIDDVKVYNYVRSSSQFTQDMNAGHPAPGSPVGSPLIWWKFDEGMSTGGANTYALTAHNSGSGGSTYNGTICGSTNGCFTTNAGKIGSAAIITSGDIVTYNAEFLDGLTAMTISFWIKPNSLTASRLITSRTGNGDLENFQIRTDSSDSSNIWVCIAANTLDTCGNYFKTSGLGLANNIWTHIVVTYDGTQSAANRVRVYKNGLQITGSTTGTTPTSMTVTTSALDIGLNSIGPQITPLQATYDEYKIYTSALTPDQVALEYNQGKSQVWGALSDTSGLTGGGVASSSAAAAYCIPGDTSTCSQPIYYWPLDENTGQNVLDLGTKGFIGILGNSSNPGSDDPTWSPGKLGSALKFDGANDSVEMPESLNINGATKLTYMAWIRRRATNSYVTLGDQYSTGGITIEAFTDGNIHSSFSYTNSAYFSSNDTNWHHIAFVYDGTLSAANRLKGYLDGVQQTLTISGTIPTSISDGGINFAIGEECGGCSDEPTDGWIDDVKIYDYVRTPAQVAWDYNRGAPIGWWKFDENTGSTTNDSSGNSYTGTLLNSPTWTTGKFNYALAFTGNNSTPTSVQLPNDSFNSLSTGSISLWFKPSNSGDSWQDLFGVAKSVGWYEIAYQYATPTVNVDVNSCSSGDFTFNTPLPGLSTDWHHLVLTVDSSGNKVYIDGQKAKVTYTNGSSVSDCFMSKYAVSTTYYYIGCWGRGSCDTNELYEGRIDDVRIFNYALTATQVKTLYAGGAVKFDN